MSKDVTLSEQSSNPFGFRLYTIERASVEGAQIDVPGKEWGKG